MFLSIIHFLYYFCFLVYPPLFKVTYTMLLWFALFLGGLYINSFVICLLHYREIVETLKRWALMISRMITGVCFKGDDGNLVSFPLCFSDEFKSSTHHILPRRYVPSEEQKHRYQTSRQQNKANLFSFMLIISGTVL